MPEVQVTAAAGAAAKPRKPLSCAITYTYGLFRMPLSPIDFVLRLSARNTIWVDFLKMNTGTQAMLISGVKSFDFLLGFMIAKTSDNLRTPMGRRRPFVALFFPIGIVCFLVFCNAGYIFSAPGDPAPYPCIDLVVPSSTGVHPITGDNSTHCPVLKSCLDANISAQMLFPSNDTAALPSRAAIAVPTAAPGASLAFILFYFAFIFCTWTATQIPYDSLGMELTEDFDERSYLFGVKVFFQFIGYLLSPISGIIIGMYTTDLLRIIQYKSFIFAAMAFLAQFLLLAVVKERPKPPMTPEEREKLVPIIPSARRTFSNKPYLRYLMFKVPVSLFSLIPTNMLGYYLKHNMALERWDMTDMIVQVIALLGAMICIPISIKLAKKWGKGVALARMLGVISTFFVIFGCVALPGVIRNAGSLIYFMAFVLGFALALPFGLPDAILADIIDYDEFLTGDRNEGMYSVIEGNLQQFVEIAGGVIPLMILTAAGYQPLGGCQCGCGLACGPASSMGMPYARWVCPHDVGYSCTGDIGSDLLYEPEPEIAPCAMQNDRVLGVVQFFFLILPGFCGVIAAFYASRQMITAEKHEKIREVISADEPPAKRFDPITKEDVTVPENTPTGLLLEHFATDEQKMLAEGKEGQKSLKTWIMSRLGISLSCIALLITSWVVTQLEEVGTIACLLLTVLFVLVPWDAMRLKVVTGEDFVNGKAAAAAAGTEMQPAAGTERA